MQILQDKATHQRIGKLVFSVYMLRERNFISKLSKISDITGYEWKAVKSFRRNYFDRLGVTDPTHGSLDGPNHEHFLLYRNGEIIGYAHIRILVESEAVLSILKALTQKDSSWFLDMIKSE
jgi:hypothetical protein